MASTSPEVGPFSLPRQGDSDDAASLRNRALFLLGGPVDVAVPNLMRRRLERGRASTARTALSPANGDCSLPDDHQSLRILRSPHPCEPQEVDAALHRSAVLISAVPVEQVLPRG